MYSWEINSYLKSRNYYLNPDELMKVISTKENPQLNHIKYEPCGNYYEMWDIDGNYFKFSSMQFSDYIIGMLGDAYMQDDNYRLYVNYGKGYTNYHNRKGQERFKEIDPLFIPLDELILGGQENVGHSYLIIKNENNGDVPYWLSHGDVNEYLEFKDNQVIHQKVRRLKK